jgi:regulation of enolase protein 1 (concanavalin A-like superfamily)
MVQKTSSKASLQRKLSGRAGFWILAGMLLLVVLGTGSSFAFGDDYSHSAVPIATAQGPGCKPDTGWQWTYGPADSAVGEKARKLLSAEGIEADVVARAFGETDSCGSFSQYSMDFVVTLLSLNTEKAGNNRQDDPQQVRNLLGVLGRPRLGTVMVKFPDGRIVSPKESEALEPFRNSAQVESPEATFNKKVYVVVYDPLLSNGKLLSQELNWNSHSVLTQGTVEFFQQQSHGEVNYSIVETTILTDGWPEKVDGFRYTEQEYLAAIHGQGPWHSPDAVSYNKIVNDSRLDICGKANRGEIDEVWIYNGPGFGFYESTLVGPGAFWYNSPPVPGPYSCNRLIPIMGPSPERGLDCATEDFGHRTESTMTQVYGSWQQNRTSHNWERFALVKALSPNYAYSGCGNVHYPPNGVSDYDYGNPSTVNTNCDDFANYPNLSEPSTVWHPVTCSTWSCDHLQYFGYWFGHLPHNASCGSDHVANDWWQYFANPGQALNPSATCPPPAIDHKAFLPMVLRTYALPTAFCDRFDGTQVDPRWSLVDPLGGAETHLIGGSLVFSTPGGGRDLYGGNTNAPRLLQVAPEASWTAATHVQMAQLGGGFQTAGLLLWIDAGHYVWFGIGTNNTVQGIWQSETGRVGIPWLDLPSLARSDLYLRISKTSNQLRLAYSEDGTEWHESAEMAVPSGEVKVGLVLINAWAAPAFSASYDFFVWDWCQ